MMAFQTSPAEPVTAAPVCAGTLPFENWTSMPPALAAEAAVISTPEAAAETKVCRGRMAVRRGCEC